MVKQSSHTYSENKWGASDATKCHKSIRAADRRLSPQNLTHCHFSIIHRSGEVQEPAPMRQFSASQGLLSVLITKFPLFLIQWSGPDGLNKKAKLEFSELIDVNLMDLMPVTQVLCNIFSYN
ncbi:unnamed protein product [Wuchereria bancrofti]|uniref:Uncharacterized protein n=1 Tax=Wuchereria bancrofti TaxID=6293 RepID=A0A3P7ET68_WUCBA|nr:unnamed protein product [Wuchereria bancrofti]